jgi:hypothetical protein
MTDKNIFNTTHWILHHRDGRPKEFFDNLDDAWAVSEAEVCAGRPQPYIESFKPSQRTP